MTLTETRGKKMEYEQINCEWCAKYGIPDSEATHQVCDDDVCIDCFREAYE